MAIIEDKEMEMRGAERVERREGGVGNGEANGTGQHREAEKTRGVKSKLGTKKMGLEVAMETLAKRWCVK